MHIPKSFEKDLPEWDESYITLIKGQTKKLKKLANGAGKGSDLFKNACIRLLDLAIAGRIDEVPGALNRSVDVRALAFLMADAKQFDNYEPDTELLSKVLEVQNPVSRIGLLDFKKVYMKRFDLLPPSTLDSFSTFLKEQSQHYITKDQSSDLTKIGQNAAMLFDLSGPSKVVEAAKLRGADLQSFFCELGLEGTEKGRYREICQYLYYLETLKTIPVGKADPVLKKVCNPEVYSAPGVDFPLLGHEVLSILIDRAEQGSVSDAWQKVVLTIAGDPRVPQTDAKYQKWWVLLGEGRVAKVKSWLSKFDLELFLKVLDQYGKDSGDEDLKRMFPSRKRFLEGLLEQELVINSRLYLTYDADHFVCRNYEKNEVPNYAIVKNGYTSMIYLQVGQLHMVEGTHNFKLWIFPKLPEQSNIVDYRFDGFDRNELSRDLNWAYEREYGDLRPAAAIVHTPTKCNWQKKAIDYLMNHGIELDIQSLFSREDYQQYKRLYGLPVAPVRRAKKSKPDIKIKPKIKAKPQQEAKVSQSNRTRKCTNCNQRKPIGQFYEFTRSDDGYSRWCRDCFDRK